MFCYLAGVSRGPAGEQWGTISPRTCFEVVAGPEFVGVDARLRARATMVSLSLRAQIPQRPAGRSPDQQSQAVKHAIWGPGRVPGAVARFNPVSPIFRRSANRREQGRNPSNWRGSRCSGLEPIYWACGQPYCSRSQISTLEMRWRFRPGVWMCGRLRRCWISIQRGVTLRCSARRCLVIQGSGEIWPSPVSWAGFIDDTALSRPQLWCEGRASARQLAYGRGSLACCDAWRPIRAGQAQDRKDPCDESRSRSSCCRFLGHLRKTKAQIGALRYSLEISARELNRLAMLCRYNRTLCVRK
jgi:hypothetical protein